MNADDIGDRGQCWFFLLLTELIHGREEPIFRPRFLGDKYPTFDYLVELTDQPALLFFVQVKSTTLGYTKTGEKRLRVQVSQQDVDRMVASPIPAYVVGIDEPGQKGYLLSVNEPRDHIASLLTRYSLDSANLTRLSQEVSDFWTKRDMRLLNSHFQE